MWNKEREMMMTQPKGLIYKIFLNWNHYTTQLTKARKIFMKIYLGCKNSMVRCVLAQLGILLALCQFKYCEAWPEDGMWNGTEILDFSNNSRLFAWWRKIWLIFRSVSFYVVR